MADGCAEHRGGPLVHCGACHLEADAEIERLREVLRETYYYMVEVEQMLSGQVAVRSYMSLPRTAKERTAIGEHARAALEVGHDHAPVLERGTT